MKVESKLVQSASGQAPPIVRTMVPAVIRMRGKQISKLLCFLLDRFSAHEGAFRHRLFRSPCRVRAWLLSCSLPDFDFSVQMHRNRSASSILVGRIGGEECGCIIRAVRSSGMIGSRTDASIRVGRKGRFARRDDHWKSTSCRKWDGKDVIEMLHLEGVREINRSPYVNTTCYKGGVSLGFRAEVSLKRQGEGQ